MTPWPSLVHIQIVVFFITFVALVTYIIRKIFQDKPRLDSIVLSNLIVIIAVTSGGLAVGVGTFLNSVSFAWSGMPYPGESSESIRPYMIYTLISVIIVMSYAFVRLSEAIRHCLK